MNWTEEQRQVIEQRNQNILVSAAAGSGKTAVLIERILSRILDDKNPVNIDEFLIVTFTKAAAAQMKERLQRALEKALAENPENEHLQRQVMLVPFAQISTIHSFCGTVIQNYFHRTGVDPAYRVGSESELGMLQADVLEEMLEEKYTDPSEEFQELALMSRFVKSDKEIEELILYLYEKSVSEPFPHKFLERMEQFVRMETMDELKGSEWIRRVTEYVQNVLAGIAEEYAVMQKLCAAPGGPVAYAPFLADESTQFTSFSGKEDYETLARKVSLITFGRLPGKRQPECEESLKEAVKQIRDSVKKAVRQLQGEYFDQPLSEQLAQMRQIRRTVLPFLHLTGEFAVRYREKKREKSLVDFNDLEQMALEILVKEEPDGSVTRTEAAEELAAQFAEIMIDEYQDSNLVQEMLLTSIASENNMFMVGDIKQSIYRFRMACPDLFLEKMERFGKEAAKENLLINLSRNFRSRVCVLTGVNTIFEAIMHRRLGGVEYDEDASLRAGAEFPEDGMRTAEDIDVFIIEGRDDGSCEGKLIAEQIRTYTGEENPLYVFDEGKYRPVRYSDIVVLARSTKAIGQPIYDALAAEGIPVHMENTKGFFDTREISMMVSLFQVIDNPRQDIPLAAVLRSPVFDFSDDELAILRGKDKAVDFYDSLLRYEAEDELGRKTADFLSLLSHFRERMTYVSVADMIQDIYDRTKLDYMVLAMKNGEQRKANLELLMEKAREFDSTSYQGLHQFVRYISGIRKREEDLGEANLLGNRDNVVQIMTIHKSKGLEFPVCFVAGMGRQIAGGNKGPFLTVHSEAGIAAPVVDNDRGISCENCFTRSLARMNAIEDLGEELRVLYVAMTRAKEKLIFTGAARKEKVPLSTGYFQLLQAKSYYDWVLPAIREKEGFRIRWVEPEELLQNEVQRQADVMVDEVMLNNFDTTITYDKELREHLTFLENDRAEGDEEIPTKLSVSEIKKRSMEESGDENFTVLYSDALENQSPVPAFARDGEEEPDALAGAGYGTAWHQVMASLDFSVEVSDGAVGKELEDMAQSGRVLRGDLLRIRVDKILRFFRSPLGERMRKAFGEGRLHREQPFVIGVPASEVVGGTKDSSQVLVQGIIDGYFETDGGIVLMDYKTDHLEKGQEAVLRERYQKQMELYALALEKIIGKKVIQRVLYSFSLDREIEV